MSRSLKNNLLKIICCVLSIGVSTVGAIDIDPKLFSHSEEEALFLRRVIDFWEEGQTLMVQKEIENYLNEKNLQVKKGSFRYLFLN